MTHSIVLNAAAAGVRARRRTRWEKLVCAGEHLLKPCQLDADIECMLPCARRAMRGAYRAGARPRARCVVTKRVRHARHVRGLMCRSDFRLHTRNFGPMLNPTHP